MNIILPPMSIFGFTTYKNEFETMKLFMNNPLLQLCIQDAWGLFGLIEEDENNIALRISKSINLREQGNKLFRDSPERNALDASHLYTKSILAAPPGSEALALAHANRAMALQKFGYFQQAYDDCECALEQGYPKNLRHKIIARQALCAEKLGEPLLLQKHLDLLTALSLNETYTAQVDELQQSLEKLKLNEKTSQKNEQNEKEYKGSHRITKTASKEKCLIAEKSIKKDELIFTERARSFIPASKRHVCHYCAATQLIPFPCYKCYGIVYCSLKCRMAHQATHAYECLGYQKGLLEGFHSLALRIVLDEIPEVIPFLCQKKTAMDIWHELTSENSSLMQSDLPYTQTLCVNTHLEKESLPEIFTLANVAFICSWHLRNQTNFFNLFENTKASLEDWNLVIASLILRHLGQLKIKRGKIQALAIKIADPSDSTLLVNKLWQSPFHVRRGFLHMFSNCENVILANFSHLNLCNNACFPSMRFKKNGRYLSAYAVDDIEAGTEILTMYCTDYRNSLRLARQSYLKEICHFECKCVKCTKENPDEDYNKFLRLRCERCCQIFILNTNGTIRCTKCLAVQRKLLEKLQLLQNLFRTSSKDVSMLESLLNARVKAYEELDQWLLGAHVIKFDKSIEMVEKCFEVADVAFSHEFHFYNFKRIIEILKFHLRCNIERIHLKSIDYVSPMTYLWDFIALGKYQCTAEEMQEMLQAIEILPDETKKLFINYYNDYIVGKIQ